MQKKKKKIVWSTTTKKTTLCNSGAGTDFCTKATFKASYTVSKKLKLCLVLTEQLRGPRQKQQQNDTKLLLNHYNLTI